MIHLYIIHRIAITCILLFGLVVLYITWFTNTFFNRQQLYSLPKDEQVKFIPLWVGLITALDIACVAFAVDVLFFRQGLFR